MTVLFVGLIAFDLLMMLLTLVMIGRMAGWVRTPGMGRILFFSLLSLKFFVAGVFGWFAVVIAFPALPLRAIRDWIYFGLVIYLGLQAVSMFVALWRWRRRAGG